MKILITGTAGFIGYHLVTDLVKHDFDIIGLDNINDYYDADLKYSRLLQTGIDKEKIKYNVPVQSQVYQNYQFIKLDLEDYTNVYHLACKFEPDIIVHLAAQPGVRYSAENPWAYVNSNINGFLSILEVSRHCKIKHLIFASSSSVYGINSTMPLSVTDTADHPISLYAATKKSNEMMAHTYSHLYNIPATGLRFFTAYGPWGRPDMAIFKFTKAILVGKTISVYNYGKMERDFTFIDDIIHGIIEVIKNKPACPVENGKVNSSNSPVASYKIYNIGNSSPVKLMDFIHAIEKATGKDARIDFLPIQPGDMEKTFADISGFSENYNYKPKINIESGIKKFVEWYKNYFH